MPELGGFHLGKDYLAGHRQRVRRRRIRRFAALGRAHLGMYYMGDELFVVSVSNRETLYNVSNSIHEIEEEVISPTPNQFAPAAEMRSMGGGFTVIPETLINISRFNTEIEEEAIEHQQTTFRETVECISRFSSEIEGKTKMKFVPQEFLSDEEEPFKVVRYSKEESAATDEEEVIKILASLGEL